VRIRTSLALITGALLLLNPSLSNAQQPTSQTATVDQIKEAKRQAGLLKYKAAHLRFSGTSASSIPYAGGAIEATAHLNAEAAEKDSARKTALANALTAQLFLDKPELSSEARRVEIETTLKNDPDQASVLGIVGIERVRVAVDKHFSDQVAFQTDVTKSHNVLEGLNKDILDTSRRIREGNQEIIAEIKEGKVDTLTAYLATKDAMVRVHAEVRASAQNMVSHELQMATKFEEAEQDRDSKHAQLISSGETAQASLNRVEVQLNINTQLLRRQGNAVSQIASKTDNIRSSTTFLSQNAFASKSPSERLEILKYPDSDAYKAVLGHLPKESRGDAEAEFRNAAKKEQNTLDFQSNVRTAQAVVGGIQTLGNVLGWEFTQKEDFNKGVQYFNVAAGLALSGGNPVAMISALGGLGGAPQGPSAGEMQILAKLAVMDKKLDQLIEGQEEIKDLIESSYEELTQKQLQTMIAIDRVGSDVLKLQQQSSSIMRNLMETSRLSTQIENCSYISKEFGSKIEFDYKTAVEILKPGLINSSMSSCQAGIDSLWYPYFSRDGKVDLRKFKGNIAAEAEVRLNGNGTNKSTVSDLNDAVYAPLLDLMWREYGVFIGGDERPENYDMALRLILALTQPETSFDVLRGKPFNSNFDSSDLNNALSSKATRDRAFEDILYLLDVESLEEVTSQFIVAMPLIYRNLGEGKRDDSYVLYDDMHITNNPADQTAVLKKMRSQFNHVLHGLNTSIAQQNLLSGDFLVPHVSDQVMSESPSDLRNRLITAMTHNQVLSENVIAYMLDSNLTSRRLRPKQKINNVVLPASNMALNVNVNWAQNLFVYDTLVKGKIDQKPQISRWSYLKESEEAKNDFECSENASWNCILPADLEIKNEKIKICRSSFNEDGEKVKGKCENFALPDPSILDHRKLKLRDQVRSLFETREALLAAGDLMDEEFNLDNGFITNRVKTDLWYAIQ